MSIGTSLRAVAGAVLTRIAEAVVGPNPEELTVADEVIFEDEEDDDGEVPPQNPLTPAARALMWRPKAPPPPAPAIQPLAGSFQARVQAARHSG
jgi:hypothetical protein